MRPLSPVNIDVDPEKLLPQRRQRISFMISPGPNNTCTKYENYCRVLWLTLVCLTIVVLGTKHTISHYRSNFITPMPTYYAAHVLRNIKILPFDATDEELDKLPRDSFSYASMIDAGSSGSRVHVYRYGKLGSKDGELYVLPSHVSFKEKPGLSSFASNPKEAPQTLMALIEFIKKEVPEEMWQHTPLWLKGTAGMRLLLPKQSEEIMKNIRIFLEQPNNSPFLFQPRMVQVINGVEEGGYGWIAYNYLNRLIGPKYNSSHEFRSPYAVIEMGGASSQVTAAAPANVTATIPQKSLFTFSFCGKTFDLYAHSYLGFGGDQAREALTKSLISASNTTIIDPCLNVGYQRSNGTTGANIYDSSGLPDVSIIGGSDRQSCSKAIKERVFKKNDHRFCSHQESIEYTNTIDCHLQPSWINSIENFLVFENFYWAASGANVQRSGHNMHDPKELSLFPLLTNSRLYKEASNEICQMSWKDLNVEYPKDDQGKSNNNRWCFLLSYTAAFLLDGLKFKPDKVITVQKKSRHCRNRMGIRSYV